MKPTRIAMLVLALSSFLALAPTVRAQEAAAVTEVRELERCITEHQTHLSRLVHLITEAEGRTSSTDAAVARDAREAITALVQRAHDVRAHLERCVRDAQIPGPAGSQVVRQEHAAGSTEAAVSQSGGTVPEIHPAESIGSHVRVVRGERVDGRGTVPNEDLRRAVRSTGSALDRCYASYMDRASARTGNVEISFAAVDGAIREARVENVGGFDAAFRTCVTQAVSTMQLNHTSGRSVFAYILAIGG
ncbi:MAG: hypothetical protein J0L92_31085 [Deltaproteobacteria bacterium]|nr:hypothetical protein [Deltaproteobacteria bacterium]